MAMTLRLTEAEKQNLKARAEIEGISMQEAARRAVREYLGGREHRDRVGEAAYQLRGLRRPARLLGCRSAGSVLQPQRACSTP